MDFLLLRHVDDGLERLLAPELESLGAVLWIKCDMIHEHQVRDFLGHHDGSPVVAVLDFGRALLDDLGQKSCEMLRRRAIGAYKLPQMSTFVFLTDWDQGELSRNDHRELVRRARVVDLRQEHIHEVCRAFAPGSLDDEFVARTLAIQVRDICNKIAFDWAKPGLPRPADPPLAVGTSGTFAQASPGPLAKTESVGGPEAIPLARLQWSY